MPFSPMWRDISMHTTPCRNRWRKSLAQPSVSIILPVLISHQWQRHLTEATIKILRDTTQVPFELIVVETESQDFAPINGEWTYQQCGTRRGLAKDINAG